MKDFDFVLTDEQYLKIQNEYSFNHTNNIELCSKQLNNIISEVEISGFGLDLSTQNKILHHLHEAKHLISLISNNNTSLTNKLNNNPIKLIHALSCLSFNLNSYIIKSPYQIIFLKTNSIIIDIIRQICTFFMDK